MRRYTLSLLWLLSLAGLMLGGCQSIPGPPPLAGQQAAEAPAPEEPVTLVLASHDSFNVSQEVIAQFEEMYNVKFQYLGLGDAGEALNKMILSRDAPLADVFFGVDNTFLSRALQADIFLPYESPLLAKIPDEFKLDPEHRLLPVDHGFVNINADRLWFQEQGIPLPQTLEDLIRPEYRGLLVVQNPATSSPGLAFLLTTVGYFGDPGYLDFWRALRENDVLVTDGWSEAYFEHFTVGSGGTGDRPLVVSYTTSPPADVLFATDGRTEPQNVNINPPRGTFHQIEFVGIVKGTQKLELAQAWVDFMLDRTFQEDIPLQMFVYPVNPDAALPELFVQFAEIPQDPVELPPEQIDANRERWIQAWTDVMRE